MLATLLKTAKSQPPPFEFAYTGQRQSTTAGATHTLANIQLGAAHPTREVFIVLECTDASSISSATLGGIGCTVAAFMGATYSVAILICPIPTGTSADLVVTFNKSISTVVAFNYRIVNRVDFGGGSVATATPLAGSESSPKTYTGPAIPTNGWSLGFLMIVASGRVLTGSAPYSHDSNTSVRHALSYSRHGMAGETPTVEMIWTGGSATVQFVAAAFNS